jgi:hypothetical protein
MEKANKKQTRKNILHGQGAQASARFTAPSHGGNKPPQAPSSDRIIASVLEFMYFKPASHA